ncbi:Wadjet anti-phage system protein JetD domain-containing protein [Desnuesiella massiliensis]|uniref:Wadjet anti-phage system protein JetD domain-containing protein n=1 Tax=Desnuesiella massiliensis TaxID=1650662 RepID=UPI0006E3BE72|nr:Wadjet anti-phage system protein JetD domain-containing protein [Desnuesiella massiliensis]
MKNVIVNYLKSYKKQNITLSELENLFSGDVSYESFAATVKELIQEGILTEKNPENKNSKEIPLAFKFGINRYELKKDFIQSIKAASFSMVDSIDLQAYFKLSEEIWNKELPYIKKVNEYILLNKLPMDYATAQERSFHIVGDEKWIDEKGGRKILERINIWDKLKIASTNDPLMMAVNPSQFLKSEYWHLIVENKTTFLALMEVLKDTKFTSLIFGSGWKIVSNIVMLESQLGLKGAHKLYYFGDLDYEGISIWNSLNQKIGAELAIDFYSELLKKPGSAGKETQQKNEKALNNFIKNFNSEEQASILKLLEKGDYLPQEGLGKEELQNIWRSAVWGQI